jgi:hypothetical protein
MFFEYLYYVGFCDEINFVKLPTRRQLRGLGVTKDGKTIF